MIYQNRIHYFKQRYLNPFLIHSNQEIYNEEDADYVFSLSEEKAIIKWDAIVEAYLEKGMFVEEIKNIEKIFPHYFIL